MNRHFAFGLRAVAQPVRLGAVLSLALIVAGCAGGGSGNYGPQKTALPSGSSCKTILSDLRRMDRRGVPAKVEAANKGRKLSRKSQKSVDRYNRLLSQYLGARCHA